MAVKIFRISNILRGRSLVANYVVSSRKVQQRSTEKVDHLPTRYGGKTNVTVLPGAGIGPEIMESTLKVLSAAEAPLSYEILTWSEDADAAEEFENALTSIRRNRVAIKGNIETKSKDPNIISRNITLRKTLDLYVYVLPLKTFPNFANRFGPIDITVIRQNTEGEYLMLEHEVTPGNVESLKIITRFNSERLAEFAFNYAIANQRKSVTVVHNAEIEFSTEGLFLEAVETVSAKYPGIPVDIKGVGLTVSQMAKNPQLFDIILATNLNGSMVSNFLSGMIGGPGLSAGTNYSEDGIAIFEPGARNKGSSISGKKIANPVAMIMAGINLLEYLGYKNTADIIRNSVFSTLVYDKVHTKDLGGNATTEEITANIIRHIRKKLAAKNLKRQGLSLHNRWRTYCKLEEPKEKEKEKEKPKEVK